MKLRLLGILCAVYAVLLVYASLMPFDFSEDWAGLDRFWAVWPLHPDARLSGSDAVSNFLLYVPLGFMLATWCRLDRALPRWFALLGPATAGAAVSLMVEFIQSNSPTRTSSVQDLILNSAGSLLGAAVGTAWGRRMWISLIRWLRVRWRWRPLSLAAMGMMALLAGEALFPFMPTLLMSRVWRNLKSSHLSLSAGLAAQPWHHWLVLKVCAYAALTILLAASSMSLSWRRWPRAATLAACLAAFLEACQPFIEGSQQANVASMVLAWGGCVIGMVGGLAMGGRLSARAKRALALAGLALCLVYLEWQPFSFGWSPAAMSRKMPQGMQWLPLYHFGLGGRAQAVSTFIRTPALVAALIYTLRLGGGWLDRGGRRRRVLKAVGLAAGLGMVLETGQFLLPRTPSVTDVTCFAIGGLLGAWVGRRRSAEGARTGSE